MGNRVFRIWMRLRRGFKQTAGPSLATLTQDDKVGGAESIAVERRLQVYFCNTLIRELEPAIHHSTLVQDDNFCGWGFPEKR